MKPIAKQKRARRITIQGYRSETKDFGPVRVVVERVDRGWAMHRRHVQDGTQERGASSCYTVSHIASGRLGAAFLTKDNAYRVLATYADTFPWIPHAKLKRVDGPWRVWSMRLFKGEFGPFPRCAPAFLPAKRRRRAA